MTHFVPNRIETCSMFFVQNEYLMTEYKDLSGVRIKEQEARRDNKKYPDPIRSHVKTKKTRLAFHRRGTVRPENAWQIFKAESFFPPSVRREVKGFSELLLLLINLLSVAYPSSHFV